MKKTLLVAAIVLASLSSAWAQYNPLTGSQALPELYSPQLLAERGALLGSSGPAADALNPATSATVQRATIDASYLALSGFGPLAGGGWGGHVANFGLILPTRVAVFSGSAHLVSSTLSGLPWGTTVAVHASAAKELYPGWLAGTGVRFLVGGADQFDFGVGLDLGLIRQTGPFGALDNLTWAIAFQNIGKWYEPVSGAGALPAPFTPVFAVSFDALSFDWLTLALSASLESPAFQNVVFDVGARATLFEVVTLHGGWGIDLLETVRTDITARSLLPSFGLSVSFTAGLGEEGFAAERGWTETDVQTTVSAAPLYNDIWAIGGGLNASLGVIDTSGPVVSVRYPERAAISPNNDGTQDALVVPVEITDERFVVEWEFAVSADDGSLVRTIRNIDNRPENTGLQSFVDRVLEVRSGVPVPPTIRWDGNTNSGARAADGLYRFSLEAIDDNGNRGRSAEFEVVVDSTPPSIIIGDLAGDDLIFSPNDDGNKDQLVIPQSGSVEQLWTAEIRNSGNRTVRTFSFPDVDPDALIWDGRGDGGEIQPDGVYRYIIQSTDPAGNDVRAEVSNIIINTEPTPVGLAISGGQFSPDGDGVQDSVTLSPEVPVLIGLTGWSLVVRDTTGNPVRFYEEQAGNPRDIVFDGRDDAGVVLAEGAYFAELEVTYRNGNQPTAQSASFVIDVTDPVASVRADETLFSPNGDGVLDTVTLFQDASEERLWTGTITDESGALIRVFEWSGLPDSRITWNGRRDDGRLAADGSYFYVLSSTDGAGNSGSSAVETIVIDTSGAEVAIQAEFEAFSPNADGTLDRQQFVIQTDRPADVAEYELRILGEAGESTRVFSSSGRIPGQITWDGTRADGRRAADGRYQARATVTLENGTVNVAQTGLFTLDTQSPEVTLETPFTLISPDGDGNRDTLEISQSTSSEEQWLAAISAADGSPIREYRWNGRASDISWDGTDEAGNPVPDGVYDYEIRATDRAGNSARAALSDIRVDTRIPRLFATASTDGFSPNGDGIRDSVTYELYANVLDGADEWRLTIRSTDGVVVREFTDNTIEPQTSVAWDGRDASGRIREGEFVAEYAIDYEKGNAARALSSAVRVDVTAPEVSVDLSPLPFSPDNDGVDDELRIGLTVQDESAIQAWRFEILDRNNRFFNEFTGRGSPAEQLIWDGRAADGELVISAEDYPYEFTIVDELGNATTTSGFIPIDILVIRDGDRLKVQIANITFSPNSPELVLDPETEQGAKNLSIIRRLGEIFDRYATYSIRVEGHAVNLTGTDREEREELQPLSLARAETVRQALVDQGIAGRRISTLGRGGTEPIVPHTDEENRWKNRRVEFILIR